MGGYQPSMVIGILLVAYALCSMVVGAVCRVLSGHDTTKPKGQGGGAIGKDA